MRGSALRLHLDAHDTRQDLSASAGAVALRAAAYTLRSASSYSVSHTEQTNRAPWSSIGCQGTPLSMPLAPSAVQTCQGQFCLQPAYFSRGIDSRSRFEVLVPWRSNSGVTRRRCGPAAPVAELVREMACIDVGALPDGDLHVR
jgi:hypothetical protein